MTMTVYGDIPSVSMPYLAIIEKYSEKYDVPVGVISNTIKWESSGNAKAFNGSNNENSRGLMQISERTALGSPLNIPKYKLLTLFDPDYNIQKGTFYLKYIYDFLTTYFDSSISEKEKWIVVSNAYNQGMGYYKNALERLSSKLYAHTWKNILEEVLSPPKGRKPWPDSARTYGSKIVGVIDDYYFDAYDSWSDSSYDVVPQNKTIALPARAIDSVDSFADRYGIDKRVIIGAGVGSSLLIMLAVLNLRRS